MGVYDCMQPLSLLVLLMFTGMYVFQPIENEGTDFGGMVVCYE